MPRNCIIKRDKRKVVSVTTRSGQRSQLFDKIASIPTVENRERALSIFKIVYSNPFLKKFGNWLNNTPVNKKAFDEVGKNIDKVDEASRESVLDRAAQMDNPILVSRSNTGESMTTDGLSYYSTTLDGPVFLVDQMNDDVLDLRNLPEGTDVDTYREEKLSTMFSPVVTIIEPNGNTVKAVRTGIKVFSPEELSVETPSSVGATYTSGEPRLFFLSAKGTLYEDYGSALKDGGREIQIGFVSTPIQEGRNVSGVSYVDGQYILNDEKSFIPVASISASTNVASTNGLINYLIKKGYLSGEKVYDPDTRTYYLTGEGYAPERRQFNSILSYFQLTNRLGSNNVSMNDKGHIRIRNIDKSKVMVSDHNGRTSNVSKESIKNQLKQGAYNQLNAKYAHFDALVLSLILEDSDLYRDASRSLISNYRQEDIKHRTAIVELLKSLNISVVGMTDYIDKYQVKHGVEPTARALADIANGVIAVSEDATITDITEEVAHFLVEAYKDQAAIEDVLPDVESTEEWATYAGQYYEVYGKTYEGVELDNAVRREVLGKIIAKRFGSAVSQTETSSIEEGAVEITQQSGFFSKVANLIRGIVNSIRNALTTQRQELDKIVNEITDLAFTNDVHAFDTNLLKDSTFTLYSLSAINTNKFMQSRIRDMRRILKNLRQIGVIASMGTSQLRLIEDKIAKTEEELSENEMIASMNSIISTAEAQSNYINKLAKDILSKANSGEKLSLSAVDRQHIQTINNQVIPLLNELRGFIKNRSDYRPDVKNRFIEWIDKIVSDINGVKSDIDSINDIDRQTFLERMLTKFNVPADHRGRILSLFDNVQKDISFISRWFGILEHSSILTNNMLGGLIAMNNHQAMVKTQNAINGFLSDVKKNGWSTSKFESILQKVDGRYSKYLKSFLNMAKFERDYKVAQMEAFRQVIPELKDLSDEEIKKIIDSDGTLKVKMEVEENGIMIKKPVSIKPSMDRVNLDIMTVQQEQAYSSIMNDWIEAHTEQPFLESYKKAQEKLYEQAEALFGVTISEDTKEMLNNMSRQKYMLKQKYYTGPNSFDYAAYSISSDFEESMRIQKQKAEMTSEYIYVGGERIRKEGDQLRVARELQALNKVYELNSGPRTSNRVSPEFMSQLRQIEAGEGGSEAAMNYLFAGGHFSFSDKFWNQMGFDQTSRTASNNKASYKSLGREIIAKVPSKEVEVRKIIEQIDEKKKIVKEIISFNKNYSNPGEINYAFFTPGELDTIKISTAEIEHAYAVLIDMAKQANIDANSYLERSDEAENEVNQAYLDALKDSREEEWEFATKHMTDNKAKRVRDLHRKLMKPGNKSVFTPAETDFLAHELGIDPYLEKRKFREVVAIKMEALGSRSARINIVDKYARQRVFSYFKRMAPKGYTLLMSKIKAGKISVSQMVEDMQNGTSTQDYGVDLSYLKFEPNRQAAEEDSADQLKVNPNYRRGHGYGRYMPKISEYMDTDYVNEFGIKFDQNGNEVATANKEKWNMIQTLKGIMGRATELYNEHNTEDEGGWDANRSDFTYNNAGRSIYAIPQISKQDVERMANLGTDPRGVLSNFVADLVLDRVDDSLYGSTSIGESIDPSDRPRVIPKYYINELNNQNNVSHDLAYSYSMLMMQASLYKEKQNTIEQAMGLQQMLLNTQFNDGKKPEATQAYAMFKDFMDDHYFGIRANVKRKIWKVFGYDIDVTKIVMAIDRFMSTMNLALSPFVAATGAITGQVNFLIESAVGQYINKDSIAYAYKELARLTPSYVSEIGDIDRKSKLYVLGERLGIFNMRSKLHGAGYNRVVRTLTRDPLFKLMEIMNGPLDPQVMIAVLDNNRYYKGQFYTFNEFKNVRKKEGATNIRSEWSSLRDKSLWNMVDVVDGKVVVKPGSEVSEDDINTRLSIARNQARSLAQICDGVLNEENRIAASRNWMLRFTTAHRGWLVLAAQRLWKSKGYNFQTMQFEEGLCITLKNMLKKSAVSVGENGMKGFLDAWKENEGNMTEEEKINIKRMLVYGATFLIMQGVSAMLFGWDDDDDEQESNWMSQFTTYIGMRTINEIASQMPGMMELNIVDIINDPFVMARKIKDLSNFQNYSLNKVTSGAYEGETKLFRLLAKMTFIKQWYNIKTAKDIERASDWWLQTNRQSMMFFWGANRGKDESDDDTTYK